jgi:hypothetical protein
MILPRFLSVCVTILLTASFASAQAPKKDRLETSVDRGLAFLALLQEKDGAWLGNGVPHPAISSLSVMAFLAAGHVPGEGPYQANVDKGIRYVLAKQRPDGIFSATDWDEMYQHAICTMMLCEASAMCDAKLARQIRPKLEIAIKRILESQQSDAGNKGGWRYRYGGPGADLSVSGWQILALRAARNLGCDVPAQRIELALHYVKECRDPRSGGFCYQPGGTATLACTGTGILTLELCGKEHHHSREAIQAGSYLLKTPLRTEDQHFYYTAYYCSQAMFQLGNNYWNIYRPKLHKLLLDSQQRNGGWLTNDGLGANYSTALAILALTVEYRLLPLYQRDEESDMKKSRSD